MNMQRKERLFYSTIEEIEVSCLITEDRVHFLEVFFSKHEGNMDFFTQIQRK